MNEIEPKSKIDTSFWLSLFFLVIIAVGVVSAVEWRWDTRLFPWAIGIPALGLTVWQLVLDLRGGRYRAEAGNSAGGGPLDIPADVSIPAETRRQRTFRAMLWIAGFVAAIWGLGFLIAIPLFVFLYLIYEGGCSRLFALVLAGGTELFIWAVFEWLMHLAWPRPALLELFR